MLFTFWATIKKKEKKAKVNALKVAKKYFVDFPGIKQNTFPGIVYFKLSLVADGLLLWKFK